MSKDRSKKEIPYGDRNKKVLINQVEDCFIT